MALVLKERQGTALSAPCGYDRRETTAVRRFRCGKAIRLALATAILLGAAATANAQSVMKQCGEQWRAAKAAGPTNGETWPQFLAQCRAQLRPGTTTAAPTPAPAPPQTGPCSPWQQPAAPPAPAPSTATRGNTQSVMKECGAQWQAVKAAGTTNGQTWPQFLKECRSRLASTTSAPSQGGFAPVRQCRLPRRRNRVHCSRGNSQQRGGLGKSGQSVKWIFCLTTARLAEDQEIR